jgi:hypothetical protein
MRFELEVNIWFNGKMAKIIHDVNFDFIPYKGMCFYRGDEELKVSSVEQGKKNDFTVKFETIAVSNPDLSDNEAEKEFQALVDKMNEGNLRWNKTDEPTTV